MKPPYALVADLVGSDIDGDELTYRITRQPANGVVTVLEGAKFSYVPNAFYSGARLRTQRV